METCLLLLRNILNWFRGFLTFLNRFSLHENGGGNRSLFGSGEENKRRPFFHRFCQKKIKSPIFFYKSQSYTWVILNIFFNIEAFSIFTCLTILWFFSVLNKNNSHLKTLFWRRTALESFLSTPISEWTKWFRKVEYNTISLMKREMLFFSLNDDGMVFIDDR